MPVSSSALTLPICLNAVTRACRNASTARFSARISLSPTLVQFSAGASVTSNRPYLIFGEKLIARLPGSVQGVVVQMTTAAPLRSGAAAAVETTGNFTHT